MTNEEGIPLAARAAPANRHGLKAAPEAVAAAASIAGLLPRPRCDDPRRGVELFADRGYDSAPFRLWLHDGFTLVPWIGKRGQPHGSGLGKH